MYVTSPYFNEGQLWNIAVIKNQNKHNNSITFPARISTRILSIFRLKGILVYAVRAQLQFQQPRPFHPAGARRVFRGIDLSITQMTDAAGGYLSVSRFLSVLIHLLRYVLREPQNAHDPERGCMTGVLSGARSRRCVTTSYVRLVHLLGEIIKTPANYKYLASFARKIAQLCPRLINPPELR